MSSMPRRSALILALLLGADTARAEEKLWAQYLDISAGTVPSVTWPSPPKDVEATDDFDVIGQIERLTVTGGNCYQCSQPVVTGVTVRFYEWLDGAPGNLQKLHHFAAGDPAFADGGLIYYVELPEPFQASGRHFLSVQIEASNQNGYGWAAANAGKPKLSAVQYRDNLAGGSFGPYLEGGSPKNVDLAFELFGTSTAPPPPVLPDPCGTWEVMDVPLPAGAGNGILRDVVVISPDDAWAVGTWSQPLSGGDSSGGTLTVHWDGASWSAVPSPTPEPYPGAGGASLWAVDAVGPNDVWAAGTQKLSDSLGFIGPQPMIMHWDGVSWQVLSTPLAGPGASGVIIEGVEVVSANDIWFLGNWVEPYGCDRGLAMHWDGSTFDITPTPCEGLFGDVNGFTLYDASALAPNDVWAVGAGGDGDPSKTSYIVHWDGTSWTHVPGISPGFNHYLYDVAALAPEDVWAVGSFQDELGYHPLVQHWDGSTWTQVVTPGNSAAIHAFSPTHIYSGGGGISHWNGAEWSLVETFAGVPDPSVTAMDAAEPCGLFAVGRTWEGGLKPFAARQRPWFEDLGLGLAGSFGEPDLSGLGGPLAGSQISLSLGNALPQSSATLFLGMTRVDLPLLGGTLVPSPDVVIGALPTGASGGYILNGIFPPGAPSGLTLYFQTWILDPGGVSGVAATNALQLTVP